VVTSIFSLNKNYLDFLIDENEQYDFRATAASSTNEAQAPSQRPLPASQLYDNLDKKYNSPQFISPLKSGDSKSQNPLGLQNYFLESPKMLNSRDSKNSSEDQVHSLSLNCLDPNQSPSISLISGNDCENQPGGSFISPFGG
jgi:hypothetical protein